MPSAINLQPSWIQTGQSIESQGVPQGTANALDFTGDGVVASVSGGKATINIPGGGGGGGVTIEDEGSPQGATSTINFTGDGVAASVSEGKATVNIPGVTIEDEGSSQGSTSTINFAGDGVAVWISDGRATVNVPGVTIEDEGSPLGATSTINFIGEGVTAWISHDGKATVNIPGREGGVTIEEEGVPQGTTNTINFVGDGVTAWEAPGEIIVSVPGVAIEDEETPQGTTSTLNFTGAGVVASVSGGKATINIPGGGGGGGGNASTLKETLTQAGHGFAAGNVIRHNGSAYVKAQANSPENAEAVGIVESVSGDNFTVVYKGRIILPGLTAGQVYRLSHSTPGGLTTAGVPVGAVDKPLLIATSSTSGIVVNMRGFNVEYAGSIQDLMQRPLGIKNALINPTFLVWQRGTSFTSAGYTADRWRASGGTGGTPAFTVSRQSFALGQTDVPGEPQYFLRHNQTAVATTTNPSIEQRIEGVRSFADQQITVSGWIKADASRNVLVEIEQNFGTGGSPSAAVVTSVATWAVSTVWARFSATVNVPSINGKTLGTDGNDYLAVRFKLPLSTTFAVDFSNLQVEKGVNATDFEGRSLAIETYLCRRYYQRINFAANDTFTGDGTWGYSNYAIPMVWIENLVWMRTRETGTHSVSPTTGWQYYSSGSTWTACGTVYSGPQPNGLYIWVPCDSIPTSGSKRLIRPTSDGFFAVDAEL